MTAPLRQIAVHVEEPEDGRYVWVLTERGDAEGDAWPEIDRGKKPSTTFKKAMAQGLAELEALVDDLSIGPRHLRKEAAQASGPEKKKVETPLETPPKRASLFGFGPAR